MIFAKGLLVITVRAGPTTILVMGRLRPAKKIRGLFSKNLFKNPAPVPF